MTLVNSDGYSSFGFSIGTRGDASQCEKRVHKAPTAIFIKFDLSPAQFTSIISK